MKNKKIAGITLITLVIAVCILIIISSILIYNARTGIRLRSLKMMYNDIELLSDKVNSYYTKYGALPAEIEYKGNIHFEPEPNDNDIYYIIDLNALDGISLNYGFDFKNITSENDTSTYSDIYIINEESHHIYYVRGIEMDGVIYYTNNNDDSLNIKALISINLTLTHENVALDANKLLNVKEVISGNVPIPEGFYYVGGTKDEGIVISDVEGDDLDNSKHGNQFVWIPVNQNQKLTLEVESKENITEIIVTQAGGTQITIPGNGKTYNGEIPMTKNGIYEVEVKTAKESKTASKRISSLYAQDVEIKIKDYINNLSKYADELYNTTEEFLQEMDCNTIEEFLERESYDTIGQYMCENDAYISDLKTELEIYIRTNFSSLLADYGQNTESVNKYGGYYIGRYEAGDGTTTSQRTDLTSDTNTLVSKKGAYVYNYITVDNAKSLSSGMYNENGAVTSQLITGAGWDRSLNWIIETGKRTEEEILFDSRNWGNYNNSIGNATTDSGTSNMNYKTGRSEYWKTNNIYDLAGNIFEFTQETYQATNSVRRGGAYNHDGSVAPPGHRGIINPGNQSNDHSFRVQLYINV